MPMPEVQKNKNERKIVASLDLHGYTKSQGIPLLTSFFERVTKTQTTDVWVLVITGSGAHSSNGPILRNAVQALLEKRKMVYVLNRGKGSFTVNANSGQVLYPPEPPTDTKIILKQTSEPLPAMKTSITRPNYRPADYPRPAEVAANEAIIQESRDSFLEEIRERKKEERLLKRAISLSILDAKREMEEEEKLLQQVMSISMAVCQDMDEGIEDDDLQQALALSRREYEIQRKLRPATVDAMREDSVHRAIEVSKDELTIRGADENIISAGDIQRKL